MKGFEASGKISVGYIEPYGDIHCGDQHIIVAAVKIQQNYAELDVY